MRLTWAPHSAAATQGPTSLQSSRTGYETGFNHREHDVGECEEPLAQPAGLRDDQGRDRQLHHRSGGDVGDTRHPRELRGAWPDWTPLQPATKSEEEVENLGLNTLLKRPGNPRRSRRHSSCSHPVKVI